MSSKRNKAETNMHTAVASYIKMQYPKVIFTSESSGIRVPMGLAVQMKRQRSEGSLPDLIILEPKAGYHGLILELKKSRSDVYRKDGITFRSSEHIQNQLETLNRLSIKGYKAVFGCGLDNCIAIIDAYMNEEPQEVWNKII